MIDFENELRQLSFQEIDKDFISAKNETGLLAAAINSTITRFNKKQSQLEMQLEDICEQLEDEQGIKDYEAKAKRSINDLIKSIITVADTVEDFMYFTKKNGNAQLIEQSSLMWNITVKALASAGVMCINDENTPFNSSINTVSDIVQRSNIPKDFIVEVLRSGYIYAGNVIRKSSVIVNKGEN